MPGRVFIFIFTILISLVLLTSPALRKSLLPGSQATPAATEPVSTPTPTATATLDPLAHVPTATPPGAGTAMIQTHLPIPDLDEQPPTFAVEIEERPLTLLPDTSATSWPVAAAEVEIPVPPTPASAPPERLLIPRLGLDVPIEAVQMIPSDIAPGVFEWGVPDHRAAGWLNTSAPFGQPGNTVMDGHHNIKGEVFRDLWNLQAGDEISLQMAGRDRRYMVSEVLIVPERNQPLEVRLANASYIQPTEDERLTLITCWPYENNTHRTIVIAFPNEGEQG